MKFISKIKKTLSEERGELLGLGIFIILYYLAYHFRLWEWKGFNTYLKSYVLVFTCIAVFNWLKKPRQAPRTREEARNMEADKRY